MNNAVETYLKYAHVQMAAEAFLENVRVIDPVTGLPLQDTNELIKALLAGNEFNSKFTATLAAEFAANWEVVAHQPNTASGFSATLFRGKEGGPYAGELVLSFRSTEFIGDAMRDSFVTNRGIHDDGWAFAQIADLRAWWDSDAVQALVGTGGVTVTGYSLGGHLANAFNLLYPGSTVATYTFNGAGTGVVQGSLHETIDRFETVARNLGGNAGLFGDPAVQVLYEELVARHTWSDLHA